MPTNNSTKASSIEDDIKFVMSFMDKDMATLRELKNNAKSEMEIASYTLALKKFTNVKNLLRRGGNK
ncbi:MAG: hypothetical protein E6Q68_01740 [Polynucleobacter sp.]|nr:MAG: hypothetical protein E6Q68_01740 [Polynucleobacter sp.]